MDDDFIPMPGCDQIVGPVLPRQNPVANPLPSPVTPKGNLVVPGMSPALNPVTPGSENFVHRKVRTAAILDGNMYMRYVIKSDNICIYFLC